jgi:ribosomal protein S18 acetylase RimI-like enzyme
MSGPGEFRWKRMAHQHLKQVASLHEACFEGYYLTRFGSGFLKAMYGWYVTSPEAIAHVALDSAGRMVGFVAGTSDDQGYHRSLFRHSGGPMLAALLKRLLSHPVVTLGLVWERRDMVSKALSTMVFRSRGTASEDTVMPSQTASLVSIGTDPSVRRMGIARRLTHLFLAEARDRGCTRVVLSVREDNLGARRFYESLDWEETSRSSQPYHGSISITYEKSTRE